MALYIMHLLIYGCFLVTTHPPSKIESQVHSARSRRIHIDVKDLSLDRLDSATTRGMTSEPMPIYLEKSTVKKTLLAKPLEAVWGGSSYKEYQYSLGQ